MAARSLKLHQANIPLLLLQSRERLLSYFRPLLNEQGLTEQQWRIVRVLLEEPSLEPRQISEVCCISSASLVGVLTRMQQTGLIVRRPVKLDQRRVLVSLTPRARTLAAGLMPKIEAAYRDIEARIGKSFAGDLYSTLLQLLSDLPPRAATPESDEPGVSDLRQLERP